MSSPPPTLRDRIRKSVTDEDPGSLSSILGSMMNETGRRARKDRTRDVNTALVESALELDRPDLLGRLQDITCENFSPLLPGLLEQYIRTCNDAWFDALAAMTERLPKKGDQSDVQARMCRMLIEAGVARADRHFIAKGMDLFAKISFRKYQSGVLTKVAPSLIDWAVLQGDVEFLRSIKAMSADIADISKKSVIYARLAVAMATVGTSRKDLAVWTDAIRVASCIRQKNRRQNCIRLIVQGTAPDPFFETIRDIPRVTGTLSDVPEEIQNEMVAAILAKVLSEEKNRSETARTISGIVADIPPAGPTVVAALLKQAEDSGDSWFFTQAIGIQEGNGGRGYPVQEFVRAAIAVFRATGSTGPLRQVLPAIVTYCSPATASRILLRIVQVLLAQGELNEALSVFMQTRTAGERDILYDDCSMAIFKFAIGSGLVVQVAATLRIQPGDRQWSGPIGRAVSDICRQHAFAEISANADAVAAVIAFHPQRDQVVLDSITTLIHRGFLETANPDILIRLTRMIQDPGTREQALSTIVIRLAKLGTTTQSRDFLQRAVGLSCLINDARTRSLTLTAVIDEATVLAVADGDLDLLRRMREWSASLLSREGEVLASSNIVKGMITYAGDRRYPPALDEAYEVAQNIADPALKNEIMQNISESYVRIGCLLVQDSGSQPGPDECAATFRLFQRGLALMMADHSGEQSLRIAHIIDIILDFSKEPFRADLLPGLTLFALEIRQPFERDAMAARIASLIRTFAELPDSTDPYESIVQALLQIPHVPRDPVMLVLVRRTADQVKDPFRRFLQLAHLGGSFLEAGETGEARSLLDAICNSIGEVHGEYRQVILLSECTGHYVRIAEEPARTTLRSALAILRLTDYDPESAASRHLIGTVARLFEACPDETLIVTAQEIASRITGPSDFAAALMPVYRMAYGNTTIRHGIMEQVMQTAEADMIPVQRAQVLLDLAEEMVRGGDTGDVMNIFTNITAAIGQVRISFLADAFRSRMAGLYVSLFHATGNEKCLSRASAVAGTIGHEQVRREAARLHEKISVDASSQYTGIMALAERMVTEHYSPALAIALENMVRLAHDRGLVARSFCMVSIFFNSTGKTRLARRYYETALHEAGVIRPLSRRAFILCDLALALDAAGCPGNAQDVMDHAITAATGIRQYAERDDVFDELATAMHWMREEGAL